MNQYSKKQFDKFGMSQIHVAEDFIEVVGYNDYCFVENIDMLPYIKNIWKIIVFKWNQFYPADTFFTLDLNK